MKKYTLNLGFFAATLSFLMIFAASATPIPLYDIYHISNGVTYSDLSLTAVVYFIGAVSALLIFGRISDHLGRKPVAFLIFFLTTLGMIILLNVTSAEPLIIGRFLLGLACGLTSSALSSYIIDNGGFLPHWLPAAIVSNSPMVGLTIGALTSGTLVEYGPYPRILCYTVILIVLAICTVLIIYSDETKERTPGLIRSLKPNFSLPHADKRLFPIAASTFVATWAMGGFYQAFGPSIAADHLGTHNTLVIAVLFSAYLLPSALGGPISARFTPIYAQRSGMVIYTLAVVGILISLRNSSIESFIIMSIVAGIAQGAVLTGSIRSLLVDISIHERAGLLSLIYATSYIGAAIPSFIAGQLSHYMDLSNVAVFYFVLALIACIIVLLFARDQNLVTKEVSSIDKRV